MDVRCYNNNYTLNAKILQHIRKLSTLNWITFFFPPPHVLNAPANRISLLL